MAEADESMSGMVAQSVDGLVHVAEFDNLVLLRTERDMRPALDEAAALAQELAAADAGRSMSTVVIAQDSDPPPELWVRLGELLDTLADKGTATVRLVLAEAGAGEPNRPAFAQRIADTWGLGVIAPAGQVLIVPGGSLFVPGPRLLRGGWQLFQSAREPVALGQRQPKPAWQAAMSRLPAHTVTGFAVEQIPAGVLIRPPHAVPPTAGDLCHQVPVDPHSPILLVGVPGPSAEAAVPPEDLTALFTLLPPETRAALRIVPGSGHDLLPAAQQVADTLGIEVEVLTGPPITGAATAAGVVLVDAAGHPTWQPYVASVACVPTPAGAAGPPGPRSLHQRLPLSGAEVTHDADHGVVALSDIWQVAVGRAGLVMGPVGRPLPASTRPVDADQLVIELALPAWPLDEPFFDALSRLLASLEPEARAYAALYTPVRTEKEKRRLRRLAVQHEVRLLCQEPTGDGPEQIVDAESASPPTGEFTSYRERIRGIIRAADAGQHADAFDLAADLERWALNGYGPDADPTLQAQQVRAHVYRIAGQEALGANLYRKVALKLLSKHGADHPETEQAAANADACWRAVTDTAESLRLAPDIIALRAKLPGPQDRWLRSAERYAEQLNENSGRAGA